MTAAITVAHARSVRLPPQVATLCDLLAGANCDESPISAWARMPDTTARGEPAWAFRLTLAAVAADVQ